MEVIITEAVQAFSQPATDLPELLPAQQLELFDDGQLDLFESCAQPNPPVASSASAKTTATFTSRTKQEAIFVQR